MSYPVIETPRGKIVVGANMTATLTWNPDFQPKWQKRFSAAQQYVDSEVLRLCEPFIPMRTGMLIKSGILGTDVGSGVVSWIAPYARRQYYSPRQPGSDMGPLRGPYWFIRMKALYGQQIIAGACKLAGGGAQRAS
jgi:hypothetical protein